MPRARDGELRFLNSQLYNSLLHNCARHCPSETWNLTPDTWNLTPKTLMTLWLLGVVIILWCGLGAFTFWSLRGATICVRTNPPPLLSPLRRCRLSWRPAMRKRRFRRRSESMLALDYPDYEIVLVDDDSRDRTGAIADEWAGKPAARGRLKVIHNKDAASRLVVAKCTPCTWPQSAASGEWILATDADMVFHPSILRVAMSCALEHGVQFLSIVPEFEFGSFWEKVVLPAFTFLISSFYPPAPGE